MSARAQAVTVGSRVALWLAFAAVIPAAGVPALRAGPLCFPAALAAGGVAGAALFGVLARGLPRRRRAVRDVAVAGFYLGARAAYEEALWRGTFFARLTGAIGAAPALALSTLGFALAHARAQGRRAATHLVTGSSFAGVYLVTGRLGSAIAAHATYNVLVAAALERAGPGRPGCVPPVAAQEVEKRFGARHALRGVSVRVDPGEVVALVGPNGAGKTTLLSLLSGLRRPDGGTVRILGADPRRPRTRVALGVTPQEAAFPPTLRVSEIVDLVRAHFPDPAPADRLVERFALGELASRQTGGLSVGERRRVAVALAFAGRPRVLLLDEPTVGLDLEARQAVRRELRTFVRAGGSVLLTSHELAEIETVATRVVVLGRGRVVAAGTIDELRRRSGLARVAFEAPRLPALPDVRDVVTDGTMHSLLTSAPERVVVALVESGVHFARLQVVPLGLEEALTDLAEGNE